MVASSAFHKTQEDACLEDEKARKTVAHNPPKRVVCAARLGG